MGSITFNNWLEVCARDQHSARGTRAKAVSRMNMRDFFIMRRAANDAHQPHRATGVRHGTGTHRGVGCMGLLSGEAPATISLIALRARKTRRSLSCKDAPICARAVVVRCVASLDTANRNQNRGHDPLRNLIAQCRILNPFSAIFHPCEPLGCGRERPARCSAFDFLRATILDAWSRSSPRCRAPQLKLLLRANIDGLLPAE